MRAAALLLAGGLAVLGMLELAMRILPGPSATRVGYHIDPLILTYPPNHQWTVASGWDLRNARTVLSNNFGFLTSRNFTYNPDALALIGDSFVEASMLDEADRLGPQLETRLGGRSVYVFGGPGSSILDYAERVRFARWNFAARDFVLVLERGDVRQAVCGSGNVHGPCLEADTLQPTEKTQPPPSLLKEVIRQSAAAQYLVGQLRLDPARLWSQFLTSAAPVVPESTAAQDRQRPLPPAVISKEVEPVFRVFAERLAVYAQDGRVILVIDADRSALYDQVAKDISGDRKDPDRMRLIQLAVEAGFEVVDLEPLFARHIASSALKLEVSPRDGHWNRIANGIVAQAISDQLARGAGAATQTSPTPLAQ
jgi:hypothetical protein